MMLEKRLPPSKGHSIPSDYAKMVEDVFATTFKDGLALLEQWRPKTHVRARGMIYGDEIVMSISLVHENELAATTAYASCDFDPKASAPTAEVLLGRCVDAIGSLYAQYLSADNPKNLEQLAQGTMASFEDIPFEWTAVVIDKKKVFLKVDRSNPDIDALAEDWLERHDPEREKRELEEQRATEELFVVSPSISKKPPKDDLH